MIKKIIKFIRKRKITAVVMIIVLFLGGYFAVKSFGSSTVATKYVLAAVERGTIITSVSGSGQITVLDQVDITSKVSGAALTVNVKNGQEVKANEIIAQLNAKEAYKTVRDAQASLDSAKLSLEKIKLPATAYEIMQSENSLASAKNSLEKLKLSQATDYLKAEEAEEKAGEDITTAYGDSFNTISDTFLDLPTVMSKLNDILYSYEIGASEVTLGSSQDNSAAIINSTHLDDRDKIQALLATAQSDYKIARAKYDANFEDYKTATRYSDEAVIDSLLKETEDTTTAIAQAAKSQSNLFDAWVDSRSDHHWSTLAKVTTYQSSLSTYIGQTNGHISSLLAAEGAIKNYQDALINAKRDLTEMEQNNPLDLAASEASVKEKELSLANLKADADEFDIQTQELAVKQRENSLVDARETLADYTIKAPFNGIIAAIDIKKGDDVSSGAAIATLITKQRIAEISLNEVDAAKVKVGQKVTLTFDAVEGLTISGEVAEIDTLGTVSQGVVTYTVKIIFDTQDERVKPGMSVSSSIITDMKQNVITVASSAIKFSNNISYVEMPDEEVSSDTSGTSSTTLQKAPKTKQVEIGIANDTSTEITSGLNEGDEIIVRTVTSSSSSSSSTSGTSPSSKSLFDMGGGPQGR